MLEIYIILALSFAIMFSWRYIFEVIYYVTAVAKVHEIDRKPLFLGTLSISFFIVVALSAPLYLIYIMSNDRKDIIRAYTRSILQKYYDLELKNSS
jgi:hypothetical protein